jgi:catechol 2,3-dioxygenase-like lactoylglutathione lyase family enzyme
MSSIELRGVGQIHITVDDVARSVAFYRDVLGMELLFEVPQQSMAFFNCGGVRLYLGKSEDESNRSSPMIYYIVDGIEEACDLLRDGGTPLSVDPHIVHRTDEMELWMASVADPDGNQVMLMEERAPAGETG